MWAAAVNQDQALDACLTSFAGQLQAQYDLLLSQTPFPYQVNTVSLLCLLPPALRSTCWWWVLAGWAASSAAPSCLLWAWAVSATTSCTTSPAAQWQWSRRRSRGCCQPLRSVPPVARSFRQLPRAVTRVPALWPQALPVGVLVVASSPQLHLTCTRATQLQHLTLPRVPRLARVPPHELPWQLSCSYPQLLPVKRGSAR